MSEEVVIRRAEFDPKVRTYWLLAGAGILLATLAGIPLLLLWFPLGYVVAGRYLAAMECVLTNKVLRVKKGILVRTEKAIPLDRITDLGMVQGPVMRHFGLHKLSVETAGQSGQGPLVAMIGIVDAPAFRETVLAQRDLLGDRAKHPAVEAAAPASTTEIALLTEIRDSLERIEARLGRA